MLTLVANLYTAVSDRGLVKQYVTVNVRVCACVTVTVLDGNL